ncbi:MAG: response regulator transcription factor, partial [bacterium]
ATVVLQSNQGVSSHKARDFAAEPPPRDDGLVPFEPGELGRLEGLAVDFLAIGLCELGRRSVRITQVLHHEGEVHDDPSTLQSHCASLLAVWSTLRAPTVIDLGDCMCIGKRLLALPSRHGRRFAVHASTLRGDESVFCVISSMQPWAEGAEAKALTEALTHKVHQCLGSRPAPRVAAVASAEDRLDWFAFSAREIQILELLARGLSNKHIARELGSSPNTIRNQIHAVFRKAAVSNRTELALLTAELVRSRARGQMA